MKSRLTIVMVMTTIFMLAISMVSCGGDSETKPEKSETPGTTETPPGEDIVTTESGLQYVVILEGEGPAPRKGDIVEVHYTGYLEDGTKFDSSLDRGQPFSFPLGVGRVVAGWDEGIALMKEGGKARLIIPPHLGYGEAGSGSGSVPPDSTMIFEVDLLTVKPMDPPREVAEADFQVMETGLKYYDFVVGDGDSPGPKDSVIAHYTIWLEDGYRFESTYDINQPALLTFGTGNLIPGLEEGMQTMKTGGQRQLIVPPELAFGEQGIEGVVPPNSILIFEAEVLGTIPLPEPSEQTEVAEADYTTTSSGLKYYDLAVGDGRQPVQGDNVIVHYTGWLTDGTKFDSSLDRSVPLPFAIDMGQMIQGFDEGVMSMKVGGKRQLVIPPELGYGDQDRGVIPPGSTLIFEVELSYIQ